MMFVVIGMIVITAGCNSENKPVTHIPMAEAPVTNSQGYIETSTQDAAGLGQYSTGYRMGMISKFSVKGMITKSGEGQMLMGRESSPYQVAYGCGDNNKDTCYRTINPWYFSMNRDDADLMNQFAGSYVWVQYNQAKIKNPTQYETPYLISQIGEIDRDANFTTCEISGVNGSKGEGVRVGRIVKVSVKGLLSKTGELMMQVGNAGNQFKNMSINDELFDCAETALKTATKVKVHYAQSWFRNPLSSDTTYAVTKIEAIQDI